jgi:hypothetical protein
MKEAEVLKQITARLKAHSKVLWYLRIHAGGHRIQDGYIKLAPTGTPDVVTALQDTSGIRLLFLEVKRAGVSKLRYEQRKFFEMYEQVDGIYCRMINDPKKLNEIIQEVLDVGKE